MNGRIFWIIPMLATLYVSAPAQVGFGVGGGILYPGLQSSSRYDARFTAGAGFELYARHQLFRISDTRHLTARYMFRRYFSDIDLPFSGVVRFYFNYLIIGVTLDFFETGRLSFYGGADLALVTTIAREEYVNVSESLLMPEVLAGGTWRLGDYYNLFAEISMQFGSIEVQDDFLPLDGIRFMVGVTMFLVSE